MTAAEITAIRASRNWSQAQLAEICAVGRTAVGNWEAGIRRPSKAALKLLAIELAKKK